MMSKGIKGGEAFKEKMSDDSFMKEFSEKVSVSLKKWCKENPERLKERARLATEARMKNGTWLKKHFERIKNTPKEVFSEIGRRSWVTRRLNLLKREEEKRIAKEEKDEKLDVIDCRTD